MNAPLDLASAAALVKRQQLSSSQLVRDCLDRIAAGNAALNAFVAVFEREAVEEAAVADREIREGRYRGALHGIPVSVKDLVDVAGSPTTSGSAVPARLPDRDAPVVAQLRRAGAILIGKTNLHEFAFGTTSDETASGPVHHPLDPSRSPGGSSGGAAVAIVEGMCLGSIGTDTGGSIRIPSAACGITGLKPTVGELPCAGIVPLSTTLDHVGPMTRTVTDAALMFHAMAGAKPRPPRRTAALQLAVPRPYFFDILDDDVRALFERATARTIEGGSRVTDVAIPHVERTPDAYLLISLPEAAWYHAPLLARYADRYSPGVRLRLEMGGYVLAEDYVRAMHARDVLREEVDRALEDADALLLPTLPIAAPPLGASTVQVGGTTQPVRAMMLRLTQLFNITGHPAIAIPAGTGRDGFPRSFQLVGKRGATARLLDAALTLERQLAGGAGSVGGGTG
ncbi:MAG TPA: amidase [Vicinamibacterales bacterium]|nr:amidase [Vicinamibacterales bacterium]